MFLRKQAQKVFFKDVLATLVIFLTFSQKQRVRVEKINIASFNLLFEKEHLRKT